jgi:hypothetical protein
MEKLQEYAPSKARQEGLTCQNLHSANQKAPKENPGHVNSRINQFHEVSGSFAPITGTRAHMVLVAEIFPVGDRDGS